MAGPLPAHLYRVGRCVHPQRDHTYRIAYRTTRQLRRFDGYDEVYWNATGNFWSFPILSATAEVHLPEGAKSLQVAGYTGGSGKAAAIILSAARAPAMCSSSPPAGWSPARG